MADHFGLELVNLAQPAYSNDLITGDIIQAGINRHSYTDMVIIGWTSHIRLGFKDHHGWFSVRPNSKDDIGDRRRLNDLMCKNLDTNWLMDRWLQQVIVMQSYLSQRHAAYLFLSAFDNLENLVKKNALNDMVDRRLFVGWPDQQMVDMIYGTPLAPRGHPTEQGHVRIASALTSHIKEKHGLVPKN